MSKYFKARCPVCGERLDFFCTKKDVRERHRHFTTDCGYCGEVLTIDVESKRRINIEPLVIEYQGRILEPTGYITA